MFIADLPIYKKLSGLRSKALAAKVATYLTDDSKVMDFGCGNMYTAKEIIRIKPDVKITGVDIVEDQNLQLDKDDHNLSFVQSSSQILPFEDDTFDHVLALACLHHTEYPEKYVEDLKRVIKKDGTIIIAEEMYTSQFDKWYISGSDFVLNKLKEDIPVPLNFRSNRHYELVFKDLGLNVRHKSSIRLFPNFMHHYVYELGK